MYRTIGTSRRICSPVRLELHCFLHVLKDPRTVDGSGGHQSNGIQGQARNTWFPVFFPLFQIIQQGVLRKSSDGMHTGLELARRGGTKEGYLATYPTEEHRSMSECSAHALRAGAKRRGCRFEVLRGPQPSTARLSSGSQGPPDLDGRMMAAPGLHPGPRCLQTDRPGACPCALGARGL